ncbi:MAG: hypothetical protein A2Y21_01315 [Clostridiales bacterium GWC2_40_7]|nr:MAG: hypothetical protein A2Y21_01315 [Clostridiales bacterium GWC2_40_7]
MTVAEVVKSTSENIKEYKIYLGDFLDEFYASDIKTKIEMIKEEPGEYEGISQQTYAFIAGAVEKLSNDSKFKPPEWVFKAKYFLKDPMFSLDAKGMLRLILLVESPNEFVVRNIFVTENCLQRV